MCSFSLHSKSKNLAPAGMARLEHRPIRQTSCGLDSEPGHTPRLQVQSPGQSACGRQLIDVSHIDVNLSLPPSLKSITISLGENLKKKK